MGGWGESRSARMVADAQARRRGWRKPEGAIVVARPSKWGNPFPWQDDRAMWTAIALGYMGNEKGRRAADQPCHADVLLELANTVREGRA